MTKNKPQSRRLGYARVSTYGQTLDAQLEQLRGAACTKIYREKVTGAHSDRRELLKMLKALAPGDVVTVTRIDRLARSTFDLFAIVKQIVDAKAQFRSLAEPWADTGTSTGRLMIAVLGGSRTWSAILSAPASPRAAAERRSAGSIWAVPEINGSAAEGGPPTPRGGRDPRRTGAQLRRRQKHDFEAEDMTSVAQGRKFAIRGSPYSR